MGDGWSIAWRVHDAQFWGVPQRRKRIALVADFGGESAPEILFERESVSGNIEQSGEKGQDITGAALSSPSETISFQERAGCAGGGKGILIQHERTGALSTLNNQSVFTIDEKCGTTYVGDDIGNTLGARDYKQPQAVCIGNGQANQTDLSDKVGALNCMHDQQAVLCYGVDCYNQTASEEVSKSLNSAATDSDHVPCVTYGLDRASFNQGKNAAYDFSIQEELAQTIVAKGPGGYAKHRRSPLCKRL